ncbi:MAG: M13 family metallopeptidase [Alistipes sp.]|nr:M13 family metallopeptidase [Alistipes sp.]MBP3474322.1 M13 family metallopeptidase [Alistipes sp.]
MKKILLTISTVALMASCNQKQAQTTPAIDRANFDETVALNEDFYQYATGGWQKANPLTPEYSRYGVFEVLAKNNELQINDLFSAMLESKAEVGTVEQKIADLYTMGLDSVRLNSEGVAPVKRDVEQIMALTTPQELSIAVARIHEAAGSPLFGLYVGADLMNSNINILNIDQSGLGLGNRDYYLDKENADKREGYTKWLTKAFSLLGWNDAADKAQAVLQMETRMAEAFRSNVELRDVTANYNPMTREEFTKRYSSFDWVAYFAEMGIGSFDKIAVGQPEVLDRVFSLFQKEDVETVKAYLVASVMSSAAGYSGDELYAAYFDFFGRQMSGQEEMRPRWKRAMAVPNRILGEAVGELYVKKYFPESDKQRMQQIVKNLQVALGQHIDNLEWMSAETKAKAHEKLNTFTVKIGYPDKWKDYSSLTIDPKLSYWENIKRANIWYTEDNIADLGKEVDREEWHMTPQTVNAYYNPTTNEICFPAAILQPPFYNSAADDAVNYGAIGVVIGHEMTHGFDDQGRQFDKDGNMSNWWTEADAAAFKERTDVLVDQFNKVLVMPAKGDQPALYANGEFSLGENIADQGGLRVSYTAMHNSFGGNEPEAIDGFTADQRFYLSYATIWAQTMRDEEVIRRTKTDEHSLGKNRVNVTLRNIETFHKAFGITDGAMFLPEEERIIIW